MSAFYADVWLVAKGDEGDDLEGRARGDDGTKQYHGAGENDRAGESDKIGRRHVIECAGQGTRREESEDAAPGHAGRRPAQAVANRKQEDIRFAGAEREADPELLPALPDPVGHHAVD